MVAHFDGTATWVDFDAQAYASGLGELEDLILNARAHDLVSAVFERLEKDQSDYDGGKAELRQALVRLFGDRRGLRIEKKAGFWQAIQLPPEAARPYRLVAEGSSLVQRCEHLNAALREAAKLAQRMKADVNIYEGERLVKTIKGPV
jgi:hypothetical protein